MLLKYAILRFHQFPVSIMDEFTSKMLEYLPERAEADISTLISAPMPGMLKSVTAIVGESVKNN